MLINCENADLGYDSKIIVKDLSFQVNNGDYLVILGENGAGKSTLIKSVLGLLSTKSGKIEFGSGLRKNEIGYIPQQSNHQEDFPASVMEVVLSGCLNKSGLRPFYTQKQKEKALETMEMMDISNLKLKSYRDLSGGQRQRVLLARALCATSKVLLLDEPVSGLDPKTTSDLYQLIAKLNKDITIIMISHDISSSLESATHVLKLGVDRFYGTKEEYLRGAYGNH